MYELNQNQINLIVGYKINELISVVGITPTELAAATKLDLNSLEAFLSGGRKLSSAETQKIVDVLKAEISDIFAFSNGKGIPILTVMPPPTNWNPCQLYK